MARKSVIAKIKKKFGIKGSRINANCENCGNNVRVKINPEYPFKVIGDTDIFQNKWRVLEEKKHILLPEIVINPSKCPTCQEKVFRVRRDQDLGFTASTTPFSRR